MKGVSVMPVRHKFSMYGFMCRIFTEPFMANIKKRTMVFFKQGNISPVLDFCAGIGGQGWYFQKYKIKSYGIDNNWKLLRYALSIRPGIYFLCADACQAPFHDSTFQGVSFLFALHDKSPQVRNKILLEAKRLLKPGGKAIFVDYILPWNFWSYIGYCFTYIIEFLSGHYVNGNSFLSEGGLIPFLNKNGFVEIKRSMITWRCSAIILAELLKH